MATLGTPWWPCASGAWCPDRLHLADLPAQLGDPRVDPAPVELDLGLTGAARTDALTAGDPATRLPGHRLTPTTQARQEVLQLRQLDLRLALADLACWAKMSRISAVRSMTLTLTMSSRARRWRRRQLGVADDRVGTLGDDDVAQLLGLAGAEPRPGSGRWRR
jgi:hypothetical protein